MTLRRVRIEASANTVGTRVWLDDVEIHGVMSVAFGHPVGELPTVALLLKPRDGVTIEGTVEVFPQQVRRQVGLPDQTPIADVTDLWEAFHRFAPKAPKERTDQ